MKPTLKFAFYGRKSSGKTCILAALSMAHLQSNGFTVSRIPYPENQVGKENWERAAKRLDETIEAIQSGNRVSATDKFFDPDPFLFRFATPDHENFDIEMIDYSGELIDPHKTQDDLVSGLRNRMKQMDALFVLVEIPKPGEDDPNKHCAELIKLLEALHTIETDAGPGGHFSIPISLLFTKFDRLIADREMVSANQEKAITKYLTSPKGSFAQSLHDSLRNIAQDGRFRAFPVSAYGKSTIGDSVQVERPLKINPLQSFGLEDPFIWASRLVADIRLQSLTTQVEAFSFFKFWTLPRPSSPISAQASEVEYLVCSDKRQLVKLFKKKIFFAKLVYGCSVIAAVLVSVIILESLYDKMKFREIALHRSDLTTDEGTIKSDIEWLKNYSSSADVRHIVSRVFVANRDDAAQMAKIIQECEESRLWNIVTSSASPEQAAVAIQNYLTQYPNGSFSEEAHGRIAQIAHTKAVKSCQNSLSVLKIQIQELASSPTDIPREKFDDLEQKLNDIASGVALNDPSVLNEAKALRHALASARTTRLMNNARLEFDKCLALINSLLSTEEKKKWDEALGMLLEQHAKAKDLGDEFQRRCKTSAKKNLDKLFGNIYRKKNEYLNSEEFDTALGLVKYFQDSAVLNDIYKTFGDFGERSKLNDFYIEIDAKKARYAYNNIVRYANKGYDSILENKDQILKAIELYLEGGCRKNIGSVEKLKQYVQKIDAKRKFEIILTSIQWPDTYPDEGKEFVLIRIGKAEYYFSMVVPGNTNVSEIRDRYLVVESDGKEKLPFYIYIKFDAYFDEYYSGSEEVSISQLLNGKVVEAKYRSYSCFLEFKINDPIPELPTFD